MRPGAIGLYEEALRGQAAPLTLRTADGRALPLQVSRWCGRPDAADEELLVLRAAAEAGLDVTRQWRHANRAFVWVATRTAVRLRGPDRR
jgi:hypothetical protein